MFVFHFEEVFFHTEFCSIPFIVMSGPSGGGKTTLIKEIYSIYSDKLYVLKKHTDRTPREFEVDGIDYFFVDSKYFDFAINPENSLVKVKRYGHKYALCTSEVKHAILLNLRPIFILDPHAALQFKKVYNQSTLIFVAPYSLMEDKSRIMERKELLDEKMKRIDLLEEEYSLRDQFDYNVFSNEGLDVISKLI